MILNELPRNRPESVQYRFDSNYFLDHIPLDSPDEFSLIALESTQFEPEKRPTFKDIITKLKALNEIL